MFHEALPVGEFFLWKAGGNPDSRSTALKCPNWGSDLLMPITGEALAASARVPDHRGRTPEGRWHRADHGNRQRTRVSHLPERRLRVRRDIANPLEADVTAVLGEQTSVARWRLERQIVP